MRVLAFLLILAASSAKKNRCPNAPPNANYEQLNDLGITFQGANEFASAAECYRAAISKKPSFAMGYFNLGTLLDQQSQHKEAIAQYRKVIIMTPTYASAYYNMGGSYYMLGQFDDAAINYKHATNVDPNYVFAHANLAAVYVQQGRLDDAKKHHILSIEIDPLFADGWMNLGNVLKSLGQIDDALKSYETSISLNPNNANGYYNLGVAYWESGDVEQAIQSYDAALQLSPTFSNTYFNLGLCFQKLGTVGYPHSLSLSVRHFNSAIKISPDYAAAYNNLANVYEKMGDFANAHRSYAAAFSLTNSDAIFANVFISKLNLCLYDEVEDDAEKILKILKSELAHPQQMPSVTLTQTQALPLSESSSTQIAQRNVVANTYSSASATLFDPSNLGLSPVKAHIKVGFVTGAADRQLISKILSRHSHNTQIFIYSTFLEISEERKHMQSISNGWTDLPVIINAYTAHSAAIRISMDRVHVLVNCLSHLSLPSHQIFALRPAPVQLSMLGHFGSYASEFVPGLITDKILSPPDYATEFFEKFIYLPNPLVPPAPVDFSPSGPKGANIILAVPSPPDKIDLKIFATWCRLLAAQNSTVLWLMKIGGREQIENIISISKKLNIDSRRFIFQNESVGINITAADIVLDTKPGDTTHVPTAIFAGIPVLAIVGERMSHRTAAASLSGNGIGLARTLSDLENLGQKILRRIATDPSNRKTTPERRRIDGDLEEERWVGSFERTLALLWDLWVSRRRALNLVVAKNKI